MGQWVSPVDCILGPAGHQQDLGHHQAESQGHSLVEVNQALLAGDILNILLHHLVTGSVPIRKLQNMSGNDVFNVILRI